MKQSKKVEEYIEYRSKGYDKTAKNVKLEMWSGGSSILTEFLWPRVVFESERVGDWYLNRKKFPFLTIEAMLDGELIYEMNGQEILSTKGDIHLTPADSDVKVRSSKKKHCKRLGIELYGRGIASVAAILKLNKRVNFHSESLQETERRVRMIMHALMKKEEGTQAQISELCYGLLAGISGQLNSNDYAQLPQQLHYLLNTINANMEKNYTAKELASMCNCSLSSLMRMFKKYLNQTPVEYITLYKMEQAKQLLLTGELSVKQIAAKLGYKNQFYFSRVYKKVFKLSPSKQM